MMVGNQTVRSLFLTCACPKRVHHGSGLRCAVQCWMWTFAERSLMLLCNQSCWRVHRMPSTPVVGKKLSNTCQCGPQNGTASVVAVKEGVKQRGGRRSCNSIVRIIARDKNDLSIEHAQLGAMAADSCVREREREKKKNCTDNLTKTTSTGSPKLGSHDKASGICCTCSLRAYTSSQGKT